MKKVISVIVLFFILSVISFAKSKYIGYYEIKSAQYSRNIDTIYSSSIEPIYSIANSDSSFVIQVICEDVTDEKSSAIKRAKFWTGFYGVMTGIGYAGALYHANNFNFRNLGANVNAFISSYCMAKLGEYSVDLCLEASNDFRNLAIAIVFVNNSNEEISISSDGYVWYVEPYSTFITRGLNEMNIPVRVQYNLNDRHSVEYFNICAKATIEKEYDVKEDDHFYYYVKFYDCKETDEGAVWNEHTEKYQLKKWIKMDKTSREIQYITAKDYKSIK